MRKWWRALPPSLRVAVIGVFAFSFYMGGGLIFGEAFDSALVSGLFYALILAGGTYFTQKRFRGTAARLDERGQSLMFLRYPNSLPGSLSGVWQIAIATPAPGRIDFQPAVYDELIASGRSRALTALRTTGSLPARTTSRPCRSASRSSPWSQLAVALSSQPVPRRCRRSWRLSSRHPRSPRPQDPRKRLAGHAVSVI
ncbi:hypothetical protein FBY36_4064 [Arthrobacter sp. SLBN-122]|nr:hypothetical protein FBY36_4064 [Arthrobacter sp. SLBN-122]